MKKLILTTSALVLIGGAAAAQDFTISGEASANVGTWGLASGADAVWDFDTSVTLGMEGSTGEFTYGAEITLDGDGDEVSDGVVFIGNAYGKASFGIDEFGELNEDSVMAGAFDAVTGVIDDEDYGDVKIELMAGPVSVYVIADVDLGHTPGDGEIPVGAPEWVSNVMYSDNGIDLGLEFNSNDEWTASAGFAIAGVDVDVSFQEDDDWDASIGTSFSGIDVTLSTDESEEHGIALSGSSGSVDWAVATNTSDETTASVDVTMGDWKFGAAYDNDAAPLADRGDEADLIFTASYGMDNLTFSAMVNDVGESEVGVSVTFEN